MPPVVVRTPLDGLNLSLVLVTFAGKLPVLVVTQVKYISAAVDVSSVMAIFVAFVALVALVADVAVAAFPLIEMPQVPDAPVPVADGAPTVE